MRFLQLAAFVLTAVTSFVSQAASWKYENGGQTLHVFLDYESGLYNLRAYAVKPGELQTLLQERTFAQASEARQHAKEFLSENGWTGAVSFEANLTEKPSAPEFATEVTGSVIWTATKKWNQEWERKFSHWIQTEIDLSFFSRYNIKTDCADVIVGLRWIFSRIHSLPVGNALAGSGQLFTHESMRKSWVGLPRHSNWYQDALFMTALDYVMDNTFTRSILWDGYPISISAKAFVPGTFHLEFHSAGGHTMIVNEVDATGGRFGLIQSTLPREVRDLGAAEYQHASQPQRADGGFLRMRWLEKTAKGWAFADENKHPDYSIEQYSPAFMSGTSNFSNAVRSHLSGHASQSNPYSELIAGMETLWGKIEPRLKLVQEGYSVCQVSDCRPGTRNWDQYSTPGRDSHIKEMIRYVQGIVRDNPRDGQIASAYSQFAGYRMDVADRSTTLGELMDNFLKGRTSGDPRVSVARRWGF